jgi:hypothetical protein
MGYCNLDSVVIPFVGTLNDDDVASPVFYLDAKGEGQERLVDTPAIQMRKDRCQCYLRHLRGRFLDQERLFLYAVFVTHDGRAMDATNVLDLIQNAGNGLIWGDDSQFVDVHSHRCVVDWLPSDCEMTIVYVGTVTKYSVEKMSLSPGRMQKITKDFKETYDLGRWMDRCFGSDGWLDFPWKGFWRDDRFLEIPALRPAYIRWLVGHAVEGTDDGPAKTDI